MTINGFIFKLLDNTWLNTVCSVWVNKCLEKESKELYILKHKGSIQVYSIIYSKEWNNFICLTKSLKLFTLIKQIKQDGILK